MKCWLHYYNPLFSLGSISFVPPYSKKILIIYWQKAGYINIAVEIIATQKTEVIMLYIMIKKTYLNQFLDSYNTDNPFYKPMTKLPI